jgi:hypothetical protein
MAASSSFLDGGIRFKRIEFNPDHWDFVDIQGDEVAARQWFIDHEDEGYDVFGITGFVLGFISDSKDRYSCAESIAAALGYPEPWRFSPAILHAVVSNKFMYT